jgi:hypothetical protein
MYDSAQTAFLAARKLRFLNSFFSQGVHHGRSHPIPAARELEASSAWYAPICAIPRSTICGGRDALGKKHRGMEFVLADGMREGNGQNGLGLYDLIWRGLIDHRLDNFDLSVCNICHDRNNRYNRPARQCS